jgi:predicted  nucleic acid-binding Zn-ribbon protein
VRNAREEAAVRAEMDLVRRAVDADEQEALEVMEQTRRTDLKLDEMEKQLTKLRAEVEPKKQQLIVARSEAEHKLTVLRDERSAHAGNIDPAAARTYDRVRGTRNRAALAASKQMARAATASTSCRCRSRVRYEAAQRCAVVRRVV